MKKISILKGNSTVTDFFLYPIRKNRRLLRERGFEISLFTKPNPENFSADFLCLVSKYFRKWWGQPEKVFNFIHSAKKYCNKIIWLDDSDSTGVTHFEILPEIDLYLKKQLLKDKTLYTKKFHGDRIFTDFYHRAYHIIDDDPYHSAPLDPALSHKVQLSWHIGLGDMVGEILPRPLQILKSFLPPAYPSRLTPVDTDRPLDVMFRGSRKYQRKTISFHREKLGAILDGKKDMTAALRGRVSIRKYRQEMREAKIIVSPFGWGEIGCRDFECWVRGAALMKPDMSHMESWPDVFMPNETYYPINWSFENLESGINELLEEDSFRKRLAENGQTAYSNMTSERGMKDFCDWVVRQIQL